jgi:RNA polymerase sigma factor (sigma-70 family)
VELQSGSLPAFERLAGELFTPLWRYLIHHRFVPEPGTEELAQDVLMKVHSKVGTFRRDGRAELTTWIFQIAENLAIDFHRVASENRKVQKENERPEHWDGPFAGRNSAYLEWLKDGLEKLHADDQHILLWRAQDFSYAEIGQWLGIKVGTARVRYLRAKKKLGVPDNQEELLGATVGDEMPESGGAHE